MSSPVVEQMTEVDSKLSELQKAMRETATSIEAHMYVVVADKLRDLEEAIAVLRRLVRTE